MLIGRRLRGRSDSEFEVVVFVPSDDLPDEPRSANLRFLDRAVSALMEEFVLTMLLGGGGGNKPLAGVLAELPFTWASEFVLSDSLLSGELLAVPFFFDECLRIILCLATVGDSTFG